MPNLLRPFVVAMLLLHCAAHAADEHATTSASSRNAAMRADPQVQALMEKTLKNLRYIEGGSYLMGDFGPEHSPDGLPYTRNRDNKFLHKVTLDAYSMSAYKTTYEDFDVYTRAMGLPLVGQLPPTKQDRFPKVAAGVNWYQARAYCQWIGEMLDLPMDLPTEAQWEYAARNRGQFIVFATDNGESDPGRNVWEFNQRMSALHALSDRATSLPSLPLGQFPPTPLGLYDMMTDGFEWTLDWYDENYYRKSPELNPRGPKHGTKKVLRSSRSSDGEALSHGDGITVLRNKREPDPPKIDVLSGKYDPDWDYSKDTAARCVANVKTPIISITK